MFVQTRTITPLCDDRKERLRSAAHKQKYVYVPRFTAINKQQLELTTSFDKIDKIAFDIAMLRATFNRMSLILLTQPGVEPGFSALKANVSLLCYHGSIMQSHFTETKNYHSNLL
jgi:hypothetical protein